MRDVTNARGLSNLRTAITNRIHTKPPQKGTEYLNLYLLAKEAQRLEKELEQLEQRQMRIEAHLAEIRGEIVRLELEAKEDFQSGKVLPAAANGDSQIWDNRQQPWKKMDVDY